MKKVERTLIHLGTTKEYTDIKYASFNGSIHVDINSEFSGTKFPVGTPRQPVNNLKDATELAIIWGLPILVEKSV